MSGLWKQRPWIAFHHGYTLTSTRMLAYNMLDIWSLRAAARIVTVSQAFKRQLTARGISANRITVLHNAVDPEWVQRSGFSRESAREMLGIGPEERMVLAVGRLSREKAFIDLLAAIAEMKARPRLYIAGDGPEHSSLERRITDSGLSDSVKLTGAIRQLAPYFAAADMLAISSVKEGSPNALLEAMAARLPVVATNVGGIPEIVTHSDTAILIPPRNPAALARAIEEMLSHPETARQMAERAHRVIIDRFDPKKRAATLAGIYADMTRSI
jgi:glycosyltransferase involved in cell wall biosynthesis